jgi:hypothetical protein
MRRFRILSSVMCVALALVAVGCGDNNDREDATAFATTSVSGTNMVPPNNSGGVGSATFDLSGTTVQFSVSLSGLTGVTAVHLHSGAAAGTGPLRVILFADPGSGPVNGQLISDSFTSSDVIGVDFSEFVNQMRDGIIYMDVHTLGFPDGEVRGQIQPVVQ